MKFKFSQALAAISLATVVSTSVLAANTDWPFPTDPQNPPETYPSQDVGTCKIITQGLIVLPGNSKDVKNTVQFGSTAKLSSQIVGPDLILKVVFEGTNTFGKPVSNKFDTKHASAIGADYSSYIYSATDAADELRSVTVELEITERDKKDVATKALMSTLTRSNAVNPTTGATFVRTTTARYMCDLTPQP